MIHAYCLFDDFGKEEICALQNAGVSLEIQPFGKPRPSSLEMKKILEKNELIIIGTSQIIREEMFQNIVTPKIIGTASAGTDHIHVPAEKKPFITILNTPAANARSVAEYTFATALSCKKRLTEGSRLYASGLNNKQLRKKPEDLFGTTMGIVGAGNISREIIKFAYMWEMNIICNTAHPDKHIDLCRDFHVRFVSLTELASKADIISVNLPNNLSTQNYISNDIIRLMKDTAVFISISRKDVIDVSSLLHRAALCPDFYVCLDIDISHDIVSEYSLCDNIIITPHIAGGTIASRRRMFHEITENVINFISTGGKIHGSS